MKTIYQAVVKNLKEISKDFIDLLKAVFKPDVNFTKNSKIKI